IEATRQQAIDRLFSDLLLGLVDDSELPRATAIGLRPAPAYIAAVASSERAVDDDATRTFAVDAPPGCLTGSVGTIGVLVAPDRPDDPHVIGEATARFRTALEKY